MHHRRCIADPRHGVHSIRVDQMLGLKIREAYSVLFSGRCKPEEKPLKIFPAVQLNYTPLLHINLCHGFYNDFKITPYIFPIVRRT